MGHDFNTLPEHLQQAIRQADGKEATMKRTRNKYNVSPAAERTWRGRTYASKAECEYARRLWSRFDTDVAEMIEQPRVTLTEGFVYHPDFLVILNDGKVYFVDVKGRETQRFRDAKRLWAAHGRLPLQVVKRARSGGFETTEIINSAGA